MPQNADQAEFGRRFSERYQTLSPRLRSAGDHILANPVDAATRSLRSIAATSGLAPSTFSRLARHLGYDGFEDIREQMRSRIDQRVNSFAGRADRLRRGAGRAGQDFFGAHLEASLGNLSALSASIDRDQLDRTVTRLHRARKVVLFGALGSTGIVEYMAYTAKFLTDKWQMAGRMGASMGSGLTWMDKRDALIVVTKPPHARMAVRAVELAREQGAFVVVITDGGFCPALRRADETFIVGSDSPHFFSSYVATMFLVETIVGMLAGRAGPRATDRIERVETLNRRLEEVGDG